jgi:hypothetical protein
MKTHVEVYAKTVRGKKQYFWRMTRKGRKVADGAESYLRKLTLLKTLKAILAGGFTITGE